ncbi:hypothetical protein [Shewanella polaris]|uniref:Uncharacterized protein n=1 Tax=Shewanella polaris TaxID=2588449 RepID=A0A4Y5YGS2_9GAMM|nr:hypothetical protein [Shewanella polaris]QDE31693.1 hypothetical protein FH971_12380 [Shewanella polaris]
MYFIEMFADPSDRARFLAILLSAFFVGLGVWYTQNQINLREVKALKVSKIEELYKASISCLHLLESLQQKAIAETENDKHPAIFDPDEKLRIKQETNLIQRDLLENHQKMQMLISLYFPEEKMNTNYEHLTNQAIKIITNSDNSPKHFVKKIGLIVKEAEVYVIISKEQSKLMSK